jgi:hypothetical protein
MHIMNTILIKTIPALDFEEVSIHMPNWQTCFTTLVQDEKPIKYDDYTMPVISAEIQEELSKRDYVHLIIDSDKDQHFLIPRKTLK